MSVADKDAEIMPNAKSCQSPERSNAGTKKKIFTIKKNVINAFRYFQSTGESSNDVWIKMRGANSPLSVNGYLRERCVSSLIISANSEFSISAFASLT